MPHPNPPVRKPSRLSSRKTSYGEIVDIFGNELQFANGAVAEINGEIFGYGFITQHPTGYNMIRDLVGEVVLLRRLLTELMRERGLRITAPNEFHRNIASLAKKIGEHPDDVHAIVKPIVHQLFEEMMANSRESMTAAARAQLERRQFLKSGRGQS